MFSIDSIETLIDLSYILSSERDSFLTPSLSHSLTISSRFIPVLTEDIE